MQLSPENLLKALYETLPDPVLIVNDQRFIVAANPAATTKFGYSNDELVGMGPAELYASAADAKDVGDAIYPVSTETRALHRRLRLKRKDGSVFPSELTVSRLDSPDSDAIGLVALIRDLSEFHHAQEERLRAEATLNTALGSISEGFVIYDEQDRLVLCNDAYRNIYAISGPAMQLGETFETIVRYGVEHGQYPDVGETKEEREAWVAQRLQRHNRPGEPFIQVVNPNRWLLVEERVTEDNLRVGVRTDVSKLSEAKNEAERLGLIIENVEQEVYLASMRDKKFISVNKAARVNLQYSMEEIREMTARDLNVELSEHEMAALIAPIASGEAKVQVFNTTHRRKDGSTYPCRVRLERMDDFDEPVALAFVEDITDRLEIERALEQKEHEFQTLVRNLPDFITRAKPDTTLTYVNENYARFVGLTPDDMIGRKFMDFVPEADRAVLAEHLAGLSSERPLKTSEQAMFNLSGETEWYLWSNLMVFKDGNPVELVSIGRDISEIREAQNRIAKQSRELELRNNALEQFSAIVSHDLKAPLRQIRLFSDMIAEDVEAGNTDELALFSGYISERSKAMEEMTSSLLEYSQLAYQRINPEHFGLSRLVKSVWNNIAMSAGEGQAELNVGADVDVYADHNLLAQLFQNLFANSLKYSREGEAVVISVNARTESDSVVIDVEDNGIGIEPENSERIFGVFQRLHPDENVYSGTGIGLALCRRIAESHDGGIELDASFKGGARFILTLPAQ